MHLTVVVAEKEKEKRGRRERKKKNEKNTSISQVVMVHLVTVLMRTMKNVPGNILKRLLILMIRTDINIRNQSIKRAKKDIIERKLYELH